MEHTPLRLAWAADWHLVFLTPSPTFPEDDLTPFLESVALQPFDALAISGDISESPLLIDHLRQLEKYIQRPIFFVLGNHDFYRGSIDQVTKEVLHAAKGSEYLKPLEAYGYVELTPKTAIMGHGCWADGRYGSLVDSESLLNDWKLIRELRAWHKGPDVLEGMKHDYPVETDWLRISLTRQDLDVERLAETLLTLGDRAADYIAAVLPTALECHEQVILVTHVPPFLPQSAPRGRNWEHWAPNAGCKAAADVITDIMRGRIDRRLLILSGHTHHDHRRNVTNNIEQWTAAAEYGNPMLAEIIELD